MLYTVYKTTNLINNKEYVGFHSINDKNDIVLMESESGSIFKDGYLGSGKLIKRAIEKYQPHNLKQELLLVTSDKELAEQLEREIVNQNWVDSDNNYNLSIGGNVCILFGEANGFFGKKHTPETLEKIKESRKKFFENNSATWCEFTTDSGNILYTYDEVFNHFNINDKYYVDKYYKLCSLVHDNIIIPKSEFLKNILLNNYEKRTLFLSTEQERKELHAKRCSERFKGIKKSKESNIKRGKSIKNWINENPEQHSKRMEKINKNPDKIKKTAEKHRGMKRSDETRKNISDSLKGKPPTLRYGNPSTGKMKSFKKDKQPDGWVHAKKKRYTNEKTGNKKYFYYDYEDIPDGWVL